MKMYISKIVLFVMLFSACIVHAENNPRIISLGPIITKQLYLLGVGSEVVGDTTYCNFPVNAKNKAKVGNLINANIEKIIELKPTLVFATELSNKNQCEQLKRLGIKVVLVNNPDSFEEMCDNLIMMGKAVGKDDKAKKLISKAKREVNALYDQSKKLPKVKVFIQIGANPLFAVTQNSFINDFIKYAGGENVVKIKGTGIYSREKVVEDNPEVILISGMGISGGLEKKEWEKYKTIPAVKNNRIFIVDADELCSPNPVNFPKVLAKVIKLLHPELKIIETANNDE